MTVSLKAQKREILGRKSKKLKEQGEIPAVVYGSGYESLSITLPSLDFDKALADAGESTLIDLQIEGEDAYKILIQEVQMDPVSDRVIHADLRRVRMDEEIEAEVPLEFEGVAPAVKELGGVMVTPLSSIHVKALPQDLVHEIKADISGLKEFGDVLRVADLHVSDKLEILNKPETPVVLVEAPRVEEIPIAAPTEKEAGSEKEEGEEGEEGKEGEQKDGNKDGKGADDKPKEDGDKKE